MSEDEVRELLRDMSKSRKSQNAFARELGISRAYLSQVLRAESRVSGELAARVGLTKVVMFVKSEDPKP